MKGLRQVFQNDSTPHAASQARIPLTMCGQEERDFADIVLADYAHINTSLMMISPISSRNCAKHFSNSSKGAASGKSGRCHISVAWARLSFMFPYQMKNNQIIIFIFYDLHENYKFPIVARVLINY